MAVTLNPQINYSPKVITKNDENKASLSKPIADVEPTQSPEKPKSTVKNAAANIAYAWVNLAEGSKGLLKGIFYGFLAGTLVAGLNMIRSGWKKYKNEGKPLLEMFNRKKSMSKTGRILAPVTAGAVFVWNIILARLKINQRTANIDHQLYEGHRDK